MQSDAVASGLNSSQQLHLLTSSQHADKLLADVEAILSAAKSKPRASPSDERSG